MASSRALLFVAMAVGPLVAQAFATAMDSYAEASGVPGGAAALTQALSPLDGFVAPLFGAYAVAATLLFPFVAIRAVSAEKESGAHALMLQGRWHPIQLVNAKFSALLLVWVALWIPGLVALAWWRAAGGHLAAAETIGVLVGHLCRGAFVAGLGIACGAIAESAASAAVIALAVTLGAWALDFAAAVRGGLAESLAQFTPDAALRTFEHGDVQLRVLVVTALVVTTLTFVGVVLLEPARSRALRWTILIVLVVETAATVAPAATLRRSWDLSEDQRNSLDPADARALAALAAPLTVTVHLGPEDPRRADLERSVLRKLRRVVPVMRVEYPAQSGTGLFAGGGAGYGEVWYDLGGKRAMNRSSAETTVLATIYELAGVPEPQRGESAYPGYPLRARAAAWQVIVLAAGWPLAVLAGWLAFRRRNGA